MPPSASSVERSRLFSLLAGKTVWSVVTVIIMIRWGDGGAEVTTCAAIARARGFERSHFSRTVYICTVN